MEARTFGQSYSKLRDDLVDGWLMEKKQKQKHACYERSSGASSGASGYLDKNKECRGQDLLLHDLIVYSLSTKLRWVETLRLVSINRVLHMNADFKNS